MVKQRQKFGKPDLSGGNWRQFTDKGFSSVFSFLGVFRPYNTYYS
jgi:hypothetical protein